MEVNEFKEDINNICKVTDHLKGIEKEFIVEEYLSLCEELTCPICLNLVSNPVTCKGCDNIFCTKCINEWHKVSKNCPNLCVLELKPVVFTVANLLGKIKLKCFNYKKGCHSIICYKDLKHHSNRCDYNLKYCNCGEGVLKKDFVDHVTTCAKLTVKNYCKYCSKDITSDVEHYLKCTERTESCLYCKQIVKTKDYREHLLSSCQRLNFMCDTCKNVSSLLLNEKETIYSVKKGKFLIFCILISL